MKGKKTRVIYTVFCRKANGHVVHEAFTRVGDAAELFTKLIARHEDVILQKSRRPRDLHPNMRVDGVKPFRCKECGKVSEEDYVVNFEARKWVCRGCDAKLKAKGGDK